MYMHVCVCVCVYVCVCVCVCACVVYKGITIVDNIIMYVFGLVTLHTPIASCTTSHIWHSVHMHIHVHIYVYIVCQIKVAYWGE